MGFEAKNIDRVSALRLEIELLGKSADEVAEAKALAEIDRQFEVSRLQVEKYLGEIGDTDGIDRLTGELSRAAQVAKGEMLTAFADLKEKQDALNASWEVGADRALKRYSDQAKNVAAASEQAFTRAFTGMEDALVEFAMTGKLNFSNLANSIISDIIRIQIRASMTQALGGASGSSGLLGALASGVSGLFGNFGTAMTYGTSVGSQQTAMLAAQDAAFRSFDGGGYTGNGPRSGGLDGKGGFWAIMHPKETVIDHTKGQSSAPTINISIKNEAAGTQAEVASTRTNGDGSIDVEMIVRQVMSRDMSSNGPITRGFGSRFGLRGAV